MIPLSVPNLRGNELQYLKKCVKTNWVSSAGQFIEDFECAVCRYVKTPQAIACVNGTAGLQVALRLCGVEANDEVIVPTLTFIAPVNVVRYLNAEPVFMDCDNYLNMDGGKLREFCAKECRLTKQGLKNRKTGKIIKVVITVHVFGNPCDMEEIMAIARQYRLKVIEDATESLGAYYTKGIYKRKFTGAIADMGVYSFNGNKIITAGGGGMIVTSNQTLMKKARYLIDQAKDNAAKYFHHEIGYNFRLTNIQAALGLAQLEQLKGFIAIKKSNYELYRKLLAGVPGVRILGTPQGTEPNFWFYSLMIDKDFGLGRDEIMGRLEKKGIQTRPIWRLNHLQRPYSRNQAYRIEKAPQFSASILNLPCSTSLNKKQIGHVVKAIAQLAGKE